MTTNTAHTQIAVTRGRLLLLMTLDPKEIGRRIKNARDERGWSQMELATQAHVSMSTVFRWEQGKLPAVRELVRLAGVLGVAPDYLVEGDNKAEPPTSEIAALRGEMESLRLQNDRILEQLDLLVQARVQRQSGTPRSRRA